MLNRRHIRVKVMQSVYAMHQQQSSDLAVQEKFLFKSIVDILDLYLIISSSLIEIKKAEETFLLKSSQKRIPSYEELNPNKNFISNKILVALSENNAISIALADRKINNWAIDDSYLKILSQKIKESSFYKQYMAISAPTFEDDKDLILNLFTEVIAPNEKFNEYLEDLNMSWVDDIPIVNTLFVKQITACKKDKSAFSVPKIYKDAEDKDFARDLFRKVVLRNSELIKEYENKTPNWDIERIAEIDSILLQMAIAELIHFPSIPVKVTINEYVEISKEYATPKSSTFINGVLDSLSKEYVSTKKIQKIGRGLL